MEKKFVLRGLASGALAGLLAFVFARIFTEPVIARSIDYEDALGAAQEALDKASGVPVLPDGGPLFSRTVQEDIGLAVGMIVFGMALGALLAVVFTLVQRGSGRRLRPRTLTLLLAGAAFVSLYLVPFLKYPANPPAVSDDATIQTRGTLYLGLQVVSVVGLVLAVQLGRVLARTRGTWQASLLAGAAYVVAMGVAFAAFKGVHETPGPLRDASGRIVLNGFDPDDLYDFRLYSLAGQLILWGVIGLVLGPWAERALRQSGRPVITPEPVLV
jgi:hypothetical protein